MDAKASDEGLSGVEEQPPGRLLPGTCIEVINEDIQRGRIRHALFDFDGTVSLIRQGWQGVMVPMMVDVLQELDTGESREELSALVREFVDRLTGKQTIYQMIELAEQVRKRGGEPRDPLEYKHRYLELLWEQIEGRVEGLKSGEIDPEQMRVPGSLEILQALRERGVKMYLASGTDRPYVLDEAQAVGVTEYFEGIYGALDDYESFSKAMVIEMIIDEHDLHGPELVGFGDGYVEIQNVADVGGIAVGAATDEERREGIDEWKRDRLIVAGADLIIPDFREHQRLLAWLFAEE
ncbi:MAG: HAD family hydrolase [Armatimonadota bacterium]|nr:HAD family hydrolase [Armatimonadota bacterium]